MIAGAGEKMGEPIRKALTTTLLDLLGHPDVSTVGVNLCSCVIVISIAYCAQIYMLIYDLMRIIRDLVIIINKYKYI